MKISIYPPFSIYEQGQRANQEDAIAQWNNRLFVLCDGMGGHEKGEVASQTVSQSLVMWFEDNINPEEPFTEDQLREALEHSYQELDKYADNSPKQMCTTLTLLYFACNGVTAAHIGDSRIYHIRPNVGLLYQSRDHSLVYDLFQAGEISYEEMATFPQKNVITRAMSPGVENRHRPDIIQITDVQPDDYFYMCSDGMLERMENDELSSLFSQDIEDSKKIEYLRKATNKNSDNHSAWLIHIKDVIKEDGDKQLINEEPTSRCNALNILPQPKNYETEDILEQNESDSYYSEDVVVVETPKAIKHNYFEASARLERILAILLAAIVIGIGLFFLIRSTNNEERTEEGTIMRFPIKRQNAIDNSLNNTRTKDTIKALDNDSARHQ